MKLLLISLFLASLCDFSSWSVSTTDTLVVTQTPDVSVKEGETVNITCCWTGMFERVGVNWLKNQTEIKDETLQKEARNCSTLTFTNITREDSGIYFCKVSVEIPVFTVVKGKGSVITVKTSENTGSHWMDVLIYVLRCLPILILIMTFLYINNRWAYCQQDKPAAPGRREEEERDERVRMRIVA